MIAIVDYGIGNVGSIKNMLKKVGVKDIMVTAESTELSKAQKIILPGVGAFDAGMKSLKERKLDQAIRSLAIQDKIPILGICLGMQMLGESSQEGEEKGLGLIPFRNVKFGPMKEGLKIPHMGWDYIEIKNHSSKLVKKLAPNPRFYFVHSYYAVCENQENSLMTCDYGHQFTAAVQAGHIYGTQFHPEKSHIYGMKLMENFFKEC